jgi:K+-transporting ATPase KdpF subunit
MNILYIAAGIVTFLLLLYLFVALLSPERFE